METKKNDKKLKKEIMKKAPIICGSIVAFLLLLGVLLFVFEANEEITQFTIKNEKLYTYSLYHRMDFYTEVTLDHEENVTKLLYNGEEFTLFTEPIYYAEKDLAVFPNRMSVVFPLEGKKQRKINRYTKVDGRGEQIVISNNNMKYALTDSFIYDGGDVYVFTDGGIVKYGDKEIAISKMSMLVCE